MAPVSTLDGMDLFSIPPAAAAASSSYDLGADDSDVEEDPQLDDDEPDVVRCGSSGHLDLDRTQTVASTPISTPCYVPKTPCYVPKALPATAASSSSRNNVQPLTYFEVRSLMANLDPSMSLSQLRPVIERTRLPVSPGTGGASRRTKLHIVNDMRRAVGLPPLPEPVPMGLPVQLERLPAPGTGAPEPPTPIPLHLGREVIDVSKSDSDDLSDDEPQPSRMAQIGTAEVGSTRVETARAQVNNVNSFWAMSLACAMVVAMLSVVAVLTLCTSCAQHRPLQSQLSHLRSVVSWGRQLH